MLNIFHKHNSLYVLLFACLTVSGLMLHVAYQGRGCRDLSPMVSFLDIGQGDAIYVRAADGTTLLVDTGPKDGGVISQIREVTDCENVRIDMLLLTHPDADHIGEAERMIAKGLVGQVIHNGFLDIDQGDESATENRLEKAVIALKKRKVTAGEVIDIGGARAEVLFPIDEPYVSSSTGTTTTKKQKVQKSKKVDDNDFSLVVRLTIRLHNGSETFMLTGDAPQKVERDIIYKNCLVIADGDTVTDVATPSCSKLKSDILKLGHHGSKHSSATEFLRAVAPDESVVSAGKDNSYHHPNEETIQRVEEQARQSKKPLRIRETFTEGSVTYR